MNKKTKDQIKARLEKNAIIFTGNEDGNDTVLKILSVDDEKIEVESIENTEISKDCLNKFCKAKTKQNRFSIPISSINFNNYGIYWTVNDYFKIGDSLGKTKIKDIESTNNSSLLKNFKIVLENGKKLLFSDIAIRKEKDFYIADLSNGYLSNKMTLDSAGLMEFIIVPKSIKLDGTKFTPDGIFYDACRPNIEKFLMFKLTPRLKKALEKTDITYQICVDGCNLDEGCVEWLKNGNVVGSDLALISFDALKLLEKKEVKSEQSNANNEINIAATRVASKQIKDLALSKIGLLNNGLNEFKETNIGNGVLAYLIGGAMNSIPVKGKIKDFASKVGSEMRCDGLSKMQTEIISKLSNVIKSEIVALPPEKIIVERRGEKRI